MNGSETQNKNILLDIFYWLFNYFGPQHWWPAETPFEVIIGAILTQSAAWKNVEKAIGNLKTAGLLSPEALRRISVEELGQMIRSCGYYNAKAIKLKAFVSWLGRYYSDDLNTLFSLDTDELRRQLLTVHGIGEETADSIMLYAAGKPVFVIDAYTKRIISRFGLIPFRESYGALQSFFMRSLPSDPALFNEYHALLVALGKKFCRKRPVCTDCILRSQCAAGRLSCSSTSTQANKIVNR